MCLGGKYAIAFKKSMFDIFPWPPVGIWAMSNSLSPCGPSCAMGLFCGLHQHPGATAGEPPGRAGSFQKC